MISGSIIFYYLKLHLIIQPSVLTEKQRIARFKASFYKNSISPAPGPVGRGAADQESGSDPLGGGQRDSVAIRVSVIKTNKRNQPEPETLPLFRLLLDYC